MLGFREPMFLQLTAIQSSSQVVRIASLRSRLRVKKLLAEGVYLEVHGTCEPSRTVLLTHL